MIDCAAKRRKGVVMPALGSGRQYAVLQQCENYVQREGRIKLEMLS